MQHPRAHVLQLAAWGQHQSEFGWQTDRVILTENGKIIAGAQLQFWRLPGGIGTRAYIPFGAYVTHESQWQNLWAAVRQCAKKYRAAWLKWEAGHYLNAPPPNFTQWGFRPSLQTIQPPRTVMIDISGDEEAILARMNQGTRRKVRQAQKNDIRYYQAAPDDVAKFTRMIFTTGARNEFHIHEPTYYQRAYELLAPGNHAALILAQHEGDDLAGIFVTACGTTAQYLYGASSNIKRNLMATYGVQWAAIQWAKARGCGYYDMWGIPDYDETELEAQFQTRDDGLWGVYGFKRGWGGTVVRSAGAYDMVYNPLLYHAYQWVQQRRENKIIKIQDEQI
jgi:lipid II:glycine glycyltransferase (peptidoglycan interpeptide bridge formation enzyme)